MRPARRPSIGNVLVSPLIGDRLTSAVPEAPSALLSRDRVLMRHQQPCGDNDRSWPGPASQLLH